MRLRWLLATTAAILPTSVAEGGTLSFSVQASSAGIYLRDGPGKVGEDGVYLR